MIKKFLFFPILLFLGYGLFSNSDFSTISSGIAIFIVGMFFMEDGFKMFTGGALEKILHKTTDSLVKSIFSGMIATTLVQSSSLISVITISFLSANLIALSNAIGIIFGSNIGSTTTAWIVASFGIKIKIATYAMPMLVFGVLFTFFKNRVYKGLGNILLGLGFIFLGIAYMVDGFETLKSGIDLSQYAIEGYLGIAVYILVGAVATIIIQSSGATMALIITAVASGQVEYINALSLAIGANIGTTVTAVLGSLTSNANGKRLAVAHLIFNMATAAFAIIFIYVIKDLVDFLSAVVGIGDNDIAMKLSLFHTIFNISGVLIVAPFTKKLVAFLQTLFIYKGEKRGKPMYLDPVVIKVPDSSLVAIRNETIHLYDAVSHLMIQSLRLHRHEVWSELELVKVIETVKDEAVNVDKVYEERIKFLYSDILRYAVMAEKYMNEPEREQTYQFKIACRNIIEMLKEIRELQKNIANYMKGDNSDIKKEYNFLRENMAEILRIYLRI
jgi:phosphate:Na+ symporter